MEDWRPSVTRVSFLFSEEDWMRQAACAGSAPNKRLNPDAPDIFFPEKGESPNPGKIVCSRCTVRSDCNNYKERTESRHGMWAGKIVKRKKEE